jgi:RNA polymerase sigma-70 factor (ECF subfamily)
VLNLPDLYRTVVMLRDVEELSVSETAVALSLAEPAVKVRLHWGHTLMRGWLVARIGSSAKHAFPFMASRCDRVVQAVFLKIAGLETDNL